MRAFSTAATGMFAHEKLIEVISNNLANMNTTAYKRQEVRFEDLLYQSESRMGSTTNNRTIPTGLEIGLGVKVAGVTRIGNEGELNPTHNPLDIAIRGKGYFQIEMDNGQVGYTRAGNFVLNAEGIITTTEGHIVQPSIAIPANAQAINIAHNGQVSVRVPGTPSTWQIVGQFELVNFNNEPNGLQAIGGNLFIATEASGAPVIGTPSVDGMGTLLQEYLETSNINAISEITSLITAQRGYELCSKVIQAGDEMMQTAARAKS